VSEGKSGKGSRWLWVVVLSIILSTVIALTGPYIRFMAKQWHPGSWGVMPLGAMVVLLLLAGLNALQERRKRKPLLTPGETLGAFMIIMMGGWASTWSFVETQMPLLTSPWVFASPENSWAERIVPFLPRWAMGPADEPWASAFYNGLPPGASMPWALWVRPVAAWSLFAVSLALFSISLGGFVSRQWIEHDRLAFPYAEVLSGLVRGFMSSRLFWIGVAVAAAVPAWNVAQRFFPIVQPLSLDFGGGGPDGVEWLKGVPKDFWVGLSLNFTMLGLMYFVHRDIVASIIIFFFLLGIQGYFTSLAGFKLEHGELFGYQNSLDGWMLGGSLMTFVVWGLWSSRGWLVTYVKAGWEGGKSKEEYSWLSPRVTLVSFSIGLVAVTAWMVALGLRGWQVVPFIIAKAVSYIGIARMAAEAAVENDLGISPVDYVVVLGTKAIVPAGFVALALSYSWLTGMGTNMTERALAGEKMHSYARFPRGTFAAVLVAVGLATAGAMLGTAWTAYKYGANNFGDWLYQWHMRIMYDQAMECSRQPTGLDWPRLGWFGAGGVMMVAIVFLRNNVVGWFLHPVGFLVAFAGKGVIFNGGLAWLLKTLFLKLGGAETYERYKPFFAGLVVGGFIPAFIGFLLATLYYLQYGRVLGAG